MENNRIYSFNPLHNENTRTIIIGTLPGKESLKRDQYYAEPNNLFWDIIYRTLNNTWIIDELVHEKTDYEQRCKLLLSKNFGLWDIIKSAIRSNSSDSKIKDPEFNDFPSFLSDSSSVKYLLFNGRKSFDYFKQAYPDLLRRFPYDQIYSTSSQSPKNAFIILQQWREKLTNTHKFT